MAPAVRIRGLTSHVLNRAPGSRLSLRGPASLMAGATSWHIRRPPEPLGSKNPCAGFAHASTGVPGRSTETVDATKGQTMAVVTTRQLLENGVHFGHQTRRWNPKMKRFIFNERNGIYIIDLRQSLRYIDKAYGFISGVVGRGGQVLFVGTKKQAQEAISEQATRVGMPYVNQRWLGGMLTNFQTISKRIGRLKELESMDLENVVPGGLTKKELLGLRREKDKLEKSLGGIRDMARVPQAVWVVDTKKEHLAIDEARKLKIPVVAILDTNCDPDEVDYPIPGNDDAIRSVSLLTRIVADAVAEGLVSRSQGGMEQAAAEPMPDWERELLGASDEVPQTEAAPAEPAADVEEIEAVAPLAAADNDQVLEDEAAVLAEEPGEVAAAEDAPTQTSTN